MTRHTVQGRTEAEVSWFRRRTLIQAAAAWTAGGGWAAAQAQQRSNIVQLVGDVQINGRRLLPQDTVQTGDTLQTGPGSQLVFVIGRDAFHVRQNSVLKVERGATLNVVSMLRLVGGAVVSVWGPGSLRQIVTPTLTAGIRGTGVYTEFYPESGRSYFCTCYGKVDLVTPLERTVSVSGYHDSWFAEPQPVQGRSLVPATGMNHNDQELEFLAGLVSQRTAWQVTGRKEKSAIAH